VLHLLCESATSNSWGHQTWTSCTSLQVVQGAQPRSIDWDYVLQDQDYNDEALVMARQWIWEIPWSSLADPQSGIAFQVRATVYVNDDTEATGIFDMSVPAPFDAFSIPAPGQFLPIDVITPGGVASRVSIEVTQ
jgi:hypothetical protein